MRLAPGWSLSGPGPAGAAAAGRLGLGRALALTGSCLHRSHNSGARRVRLQDCAVVGAINQPLCVIRDTCRTLQRRPVLSGTNDKAVIG